MKNTDDNFTKWCDLSLWQATWSNHDELIDDFLKRLPLWKKFPSQHEDRMMSLDRVSSALSKLETALDDLENAVRELSAKKTDAAEYFNRTIGLNELVEFLGSLPRPENRSCFHDLQQTSSKRKKQMRKLEVPYSLGWAAELYPRTDRVIKKHRQRHWRHGCRHRCRDRLISGTLRGGKKYLDRDSLAQTKGRLERREITALQARLDVLDRIVQACGAAIIFHWVAFHNPPLKIARKYHDDEEMELVPLLMPERSRKDILSGKVIPSSHRTGSGPQVDHLWFSFVYNWKQIDIVHGKKTSVSKMMKLLDAAARKIAPNPIEDEPALERKLRKILGSVNRMERAN